MRRQPFVATVRRNAAISACRSLADALPRNPIIGIATCCARAEAFKDEQGLPSSEAEPAVECQEAGRERRADVRDRGRGHEEAERLGALRRGEPVGEHLGRRVGHPPALRWSY
jgi:hypothetical protein